MELQHLISTFIFFFAVIDPIGTVPVYIAITNGMTPELKIKIATKAVVVSAGVLLFFLAMGELILDAIEVPVSAFQIAGGVVLLLFALTMIFGESKPDEEIKLIDNAMEKAVYPLAIPSIASPGAMLGAVLLTKNDSMSILSQAQTALVMLSVLLVVYVFLRLANWLFQFIGSAGASIISRVMGLILASVATNSILEGIVLYFNL
jgi:multiple antibiotic resistance protein